MKDAPLSDLLRQASIKIENQFITFSNSSWKDCADTVISTGEYIIFHQGEKIDHGTHFPGLVDQSSAESEYNTAWTTGMALADFRMLIHEFLNKDLDIVPEEAPLIILYIKYAAYMNNNCKDTKHKIKFLEEVYFLKEWWKMKNVQDWLVWRRYKIDRNCN